MRLKRPHIPLSVRIKVAERQLRATGKRPLLNYYLGSDSQLLKGMLFDLFGDAPIELHHRPALINRQRLNDKYIPDANDPDYLVYLPTDDHDIETRVRGLHGQYSDLGLRRKRKRVERKEKGQRRYRWPKRKLRSRSTFA